MLRGTGRGRGPEDGSEKVAGVPGRVGRAVRAPRRWEVRAVACLRSCWPSTRCAGRQFSRSSRADLRRGVGFGNRWRGGRGFRGGLQTLVWICLSGPDVPDQAGDPPVSAALTQVLQLGIAGGGLCGCFFSGVRTGRLTFEGGAVLQGCQDHWIWNRRPRVQVPPAPEPHLCTTQTLLCIQEKLSCLSCASLVSLFTAELPVLF